MISFLAAAKSVTSDASSGLFMSIALTVLRALSALAPAPMISAIKLNTGQQVASRWHLWATPKRVGNPTLTKSLFFQESHELTNLDSKIFESNYTIKVFYFIDKMEKSTYRLDVPSGANLSNAGLYAAGTRSDPASNLPLMALHARLESEYVVRPLSNRPEAIYSNHTPSTINYQHSAPTSVPVPPPAPPAPPVRPLPQASQGVHSAASTSVDIQTVLDRIRATAPGSSQLVPSSSSAIRQPVLKEALQLFVGNVVSEGSNVDLKDFLNLAMRQVGLNTTDADPIITCRQSSKFSFIEFRSVEDCNAALNLNGIPFMGALLKIDRPAKYSGPVVPSRTWQEITGQAIPAGNFVGEAGISPATKAFREIFIGNTPPDTTSAALSDFLGGALQRMGMARAEGTPLPSSPVTAVRINAKFCFVEFRSVEEASNALNLNGIPYNGCTLNIKRSSKHDSNLGPDPSTFFSWDDLLSRWLTGEVKLMTAGPATNVLCITNMVSTEELANDDLFEDMIEETTEECARHGQVKSVVAPRSDAITSGRLFVEMYDIEEAKRVLVALKGRSFDGRVVDIKFYPAQSWASKAYEEPLENYIISTKGVVPLNDIFSKR